MTGVDALWMLIALLGMAGSFLCSGLEIGYYTMNRLRLRVAEARGSRAAAILHRLSDQPERVLTGLLIGNNIFNYIGTLGVTALLVRAGAGEVAVVLISAAIVTPTLLIFCEALPKDIFRIEADALMPKLAAPLQAGLVMLSATGAPALLALLARLVSRALGAAQPEIARDARARVASLLKEGASAGLLSASQTTLLDRALIFSRATVGDEMTAWSAARPVRAGAGALEAARHSAGEWAPVIDRSGAPVGVVRRLDLLLAAEGPGVGAVGAAGAVGAGDAAGGTVEGRLRPLVSLRRSTPLHEAATKLARAEVGMGVVFRSGRPVGVVTLDDLAEPLTGELQAW